MAYFLLLMLAAFIWGGARLWYKPLSAIPWQVISVNIAICSLFACATYAIIAYANTLDWEIHNGQVTSKEIVRRDCDYPGWSDWPDSFCTNENTRSVFSHYDTVCDSEGKNCQQIAQYKTQYSYDYPWEQKFYVYSTLETYRIDRVDDQGAKTPPRFASVNSGDPVSVRRTYQNHLLNAEHSILNPKNTMVDQHLLNKVPAYPGNIFDYYRINRFVSMGVHVESAEAWNKRISEINSVVGPRKQANLIVVVTTETQEIRNAFYKQWNGGKKNDVIVILGIQDGVVDWTDGITFLNNKGNEFLVSSFSKLNDQPLDIKMLEFLHERVLQSFDRTAMESVSYLKDGYVPDTSVFLWALLVLVLALIASYYFTTSHFELNRKYRR